LFDAVAERGVVPRGKKRAADLPLKRKKMLDRRDNREFNQNKGGKELYTRGGGGLVPFLYYRKRYWVKGHTRPARTLDESVKNN